MSPSHQVGWVLVSSFSSHRHGADANIDMQQALKILLLHRLLRPRQIM